MYRTIRLYGSKIINIVRLSSFLRIRTLCVLFIQLIRDFFYFHFKECCFFENQPVLCQKDSIIRSPSYARRSARLRCPPAYPEAWSCCGRRPRWSW